RSRTSQRRAVVRTGRSKAVSVSICISSSSVARKPKIKLKCPTCKQPVEGTSVDFPFCSERCRLIDLGKWASGEYVVSSPLNDIADGLLRNALRSDDDD